MPRDRGVGYLFAPIDAHTYKSQANNHDGNDYTYESPTHLCRKPEEKSSDCTAKKPESARRNDGGGSEKAKKAYRASTANKKKGKQEAHKKRARIDRRHSAGDVAETEVKRTITQQEGEADFKSDAEKKAESLARLAELTNSLNRSLTTLLNTAIKQGDCPLNTSTVQIYDEIRSMQHLGAVSQDSTACLIQHRSRSSSNSLDMEQPGNRLHAGQRRPSLPSISSPVQDDDPNGRSDVNQRRPPDRRMLLRSNSTTSLLKQRLETLTRAPGRANN